jgi:hypothetical protein
MWIKILWIVGLSIITFFLVIFVIATIRVLRQSRSNVETVKMGEQVIAVLNRNGNKEFIK